ncbi:MAG: hypothetical protein BWY77_01261 [bacterium ADurb.Bin431]|nr:MAG: hypothetical protein BWY77_01261 [bacterium ADurb.Bin431]
MKQEGIAAGEYPSRARRRFLLKNLDAAVKGAPKALLFGADDAFNMGLTLPQLRIGLPHRIGQGLHQFVDERLAHAQEAAKTGGAAQDAAQNVAPPLIAGYCPVGDGKGEGTDVIT